MDHENAPETPTVEVASAEVGSITSVLAKAVQRLNEEATRAEDWLRGARDNKPPLKELAVALYFFKTAYGELDEAVKRFYHVANQLDKGLIPERLEDAELDQIRVPEIARSFSIRRGLSASMLDKEKGFEWLRERGQGDIIQETVNAGTLSAYCRSLMDDEGLEPPPDIIKVTTFSSISMTKYNPSVKQPTKKTPKA